VVGPHIYSQKEDFEEFSEARHPSIDHPSGRWLRAGFFFWEATQLFRLEVKNFILERWWLYKWNAVRFLHKEHRNHSNSRRNW
jgi:hypothetical protein